MTKTKRPLRPITQKDLDRFWRHVDILSDNECWNWQLTATTYGYGLFAAGNTLHRSSRFAWIHGDGLYTKTITNNLRITTTCNNKMCCNPKHLKLNSQQEVFDKMREAGQITVGSKHKMSKLKEADIVAIRNRYTTQCSTNGFKAIGTDYGVTPGCIRDIVIRKTWRHVN